MLLALAPISEWKKICPWINRALVCKRDTYLTERDSVAPMPQIIAWSDPNDLLSWEVPQIDGVRVVNISVRNSRFKLRLLSSRQLPHMPNMRRIAKSSE